MTLGEPLATVAFGPKHGTAERWNDCNCHDCRTNRVGRTLNIEEVCEAGRDGVVLAPEGGIMLLPEGESLQHFGTDMVYRTGCFRRHLDGRWEFDGIMQDSRNATGHNFDMSVSACEALDRVREYWRRRALAEMKAAEVASHLEVALIAARAHAVLFAKIADDGVLPVDRAQSFRATSAGMGVGIKEIERLLNSYKIHGDVP